MFLAFRRLLVITIGVILCVAFALITLRQLGQGQEYADSDHPLMKEKSWLIYDLSAPHLQDSSKQLDAHREKIILKVPIRLSGDGVWVVSAEEALKVGDEEKPVVAMTAEELKQKSVYTLETWLRISEDTENSPRFKAYYFYVLDASASHLEDLSALQKKYPALNNRILFSSPYMRVNLEMRKLEPLWLYGASTTDVSKLRFFTSLFIESIASVNSDFVEFTSVPHERLVEELNHRKRRVLYYVTANSPLEKLPPALGGWIVSDPTLLAKYIAL